ncbi:PREDICTED: uncharacterized protein LOC106806815 isoform X3 [Priapulus caudatus]|uniref:Uncharacterized protein LOC106806815 isoform X2 n=1 Tax=Priapulus caudatus TaxID=37621 RepID=A0ABM1DWU0_PRICU|nr:PREDICTED: uncharacterized protein LOC106806815 isoform X2 [Priapulus caudatus]XP_014664412.1 PREDICTED: uncharacterized protein LOC106806815 isoform X3 [Priapulus caudatus]
MPRRSQTRTVAGKTSTVDQTGDGNSSEKTGGEGDEAAKEENKIPTEPPLVVKRGRGRPRKDGTPAKSQASPSVIKKPPEKVSEEKPAGASPVKMTRSGRVIHSPVRPGAMPSPPPKPKEPAHSPRPAAKPTPNKSSPMPVPLAGRKRIKSDAGATAAVVRPPPAKKLPGDSERKDGVMLQLATPPAANLGDVKQAVDHSREIREIFGFADDEGDGENAEKAEEADGRIVERSELKSAGEARVEKGEAAGTPAVVAENSGKEKEGSDEAEKKVAVDELLIEENATKVSIEMPVEEAREEAKEGEVSREEAEKQFAVEEEVVAIEQPQQQQQEEELVLQESAMSYPVIEEDSEELTTEQQEEKIIAMDTNTPMTIEESTVVGIEADAVVAEQQSNVITREEEVADKVDGESIEVQDADTNTEQDVKHWQVAQSAEGSRDFVQVTEVMVAAAALEAETGQVIQEAMGESEEVETTEPVAPPDNTQPYTIVQEIHVHPSQIQVDEGVQLQIDNVDNIIQLDQPLIAIRRGRRSLKERGAEFEMVVQNRDGGKTFVCVECQKEFPSRALLFRHTVIHTGERPYECESCGKAFRQSSTLSRHKATHSVARPFACDECPMAFNRRSTLLAHKRTHSEQKQHVCPICGKGFHLKANLQNHIYVHTGERPYKCPHCEKGFNQKSNLACHIQKAHNKAPIKCRTCDRDFANKTTLRYHETYVHGPEAVTHLPLVANRKGRPPKSSIITRDGEEIEVDGNGEEEDELDEDYANGVKMRVNILQRAGAPARREYTFGPTTRLGGKVGDEMVMKHGRVQVFHKRNLQQEPSNQQTFLHHCTDGEMNRVLGMKVATNQDEMLDQSKQRARAPQPTIAMLKTGDKPMLVKIMPQVGGVQTVVPLTMGDLKLLAVESSSTGDGQKMYRIPVTKTLVLQDVQQEEQEPIAGQEVAIEPKQEQADVLGAAETDEMQEGVVEEGEDEEEDAMEHEYTPVMSAEAGGIEYVTPGSGDAGIAMMQNAEGTWTALTPAQAEAARIAASLPPGLELAAAEGITAMQQLTDGHGDMQYIADNGQPVFATETAQEFTEGAGQPIEGQMVMAEGQMVTSEGHVVTAEGQVVTAEGQLVTAEGHIVTQEGQVMTAEGQMVTAEGQVVATEGQMVTAEGQVVATEGQLVTAEGHMIATEGQVMTGESQMVTSEGEMVTAEGEMVTAEGEMVTAEGEMAEGQVLAAVDEQLLTSGGQVITSDGQVVTTNGEMVTGDGQVVTGGQLITADGQPMEGLPEGAYINELGQIVLPGTQVVQVLHEVTAADGSTQQFIEERILVGDPILPTDDTQDAG